MLIQGPPGIGKTHPADCFGVKAVGNGFSVAFFRLGDLLRLLKQDETSRRSACGATKCASVALLIINEVGFQPMNPKEAGLFFRTISYC